MPNFAPDTVSFRDVAGYGDWDIGHGREHLQFVQVLAARTPAVQIPDFPLLTYLGTTGDTRRAIVESHVSSHQLLRTITGVAGTDYGQFNLDDEGDFYSFLQYHRDEHTQLRQALGIV